MDGHSLVRHGALPICGIYVRFWGRSRKGARLDRRLLAVIADCAALALAGALGRPASGSSLDNAIRFLAEPVSEWTLARMRVERSEEHTSELQSLMRISYAVFCLKKKKPIHNTNTKLHTLNNIINCLHSYAIQSTVITSH